MLKARENKWGEAVGLALTRNLHSLLSLFYQSRNIFVKGHYCIHMIIQLNEKISNLTRWLHHKGIQSVVSAKKGLNQFRELLWNFSINVRIGNIYRSKKSSISNAKTDKV